MSMYDDEKIDYEQMLIRWIMGEMPNAKYKVANQDYNSVSFKGKLRYNLDGTDLFNGLYPVMDHVENQINGWFNIYQIPIEIMIDLTIDGFLTVDIEVTLPIVESYELIGFWDGALDAEDFFLDEDEADKAYDKLVDEYVKIYKQSLITESQEPMFEIIYRSNGFVSDWEFIDPSDYNGYSGPENYTELGRFTNDMLEDD